MTDKSAPHVTTEAPPPQTEKQKPWCQICGVELGGLYCDVCRAALGPTPMPPATGETSDGFHTFNELYAYRKAFNALLFNDWAAQGKFHVHKSWRHSDGELCFGGGWFIVMAETSSGQVSNHYESADWDLFRIPERERAESWDGHSSHVALDRLLKLATMAAPSGPSRLPEPQLIWEGPDDEGDYIVRLSTERGFIAHGATYQEALHRLGSVLDVGYGDHCAECKTEASGPSRLQTEDDIECGRCGHKALHHANFGRGECQINVGCAAGCEEFRKPFMPAPSGPSRLHTEDEERSVARGRGYAGGDGQDLPKRATGRNSRP